MVGIGASAGGLDAFKKLLKAMPGDTGLAFVLIPHLDPSHESLMVELLARQTAMPVLEVRDGLVAEADHVYVIPPNADLTIDHRVLRLTPPPARRGSQTAIDVFLRSLAADQRARAIGIILSGTGSHGSPGAKAIKAAGGFVLAQTPGSAEHDQMPRSAIAAGVVDLVLPPEEMPDALIRHAATLPPAGPDAASDELAQIVTLIRTQAKRDFRGYRTAMLLRRIRRRMVACRVERVADYVQHLRAHPDELKILAKDLSIAVTAFFREAEAFQVLERIVVPELVQRRSADGEPPVRVWVPGCATGEEAYSIAMLFLEQFAAARQPVTLQIFATDVDDESLDVARAGLYPDSIAADLSAERLRHFFVKVDGRRYQVSKGLREVVTFAPQNLVSDAPFSKLDLIACRNVLIYLDPDVQTKVVAMFHFALNEGGYLILGPAESIGPAADRFEPVAKKWRVYRRIQAARRDLVDIPILPTTAQRPLAARHGERPRPAAAVAELLHRALLSEFAPAAVLIDQRYQIRSVQGPVVDYLEFPPGELTRDVLAMARPGLRPAIRGVCEQALKSPRAAVDANARVKRHGAYLPCTVTARAVASPQATGPLLAVTFQDAPAGRAGTRVARPASPRHVDDAALVRHLEQELKSTRDDLLGTIEELETTNEELKASHEEVLSMNEELQSTNEELESSKEELQSLNEELSTVNSQLQDKVHELDASNNDMVNLLASTAIATVFLDSGLRIKRFTPPTATLLNLLPTDLGRPFRDIAPQVPDPTLGDDARHVLETLTPLETVVGDGDARIYLRRILPYRTTDRRVDGVVLTWVEITQRIAAEAISRQLSMVLRDSNDAVILLDLDGRIIGWNRGAERLYGYTAQDARTLQWQDLGPPSLRADALDLIRRIGHGDAESESSETRRTARDGRVRDVSLTMTLLRNAAGQPESLLTTERDITELKEGVAARQAAQAYQLMVEALPAGAVLREGDRLTMNGAAEAITGYARSELPTVETWCARLHGDQATDRRSLYERSRLGQPAAQPVSLGITRKDGQPRQVELTVSRLDDGRDLWMLVDHTEQDRAERALRHSEDSLRSIITMAASAIITIDEHGRIETFNPAAERMFGYAAADIVGQNVRLLMPSPYSNEHDGYVARYLTSGQARIIGAEREVVGLRKDGTTFPLDLAVSEIDHSRRFIGILRDLSDRRALEWRLAESQIEERRHMARELHDDLGGHMTGVALLAQALHGDLATLGSPLAGRMEDLLESIRDAQQHLRSVVRGLMPVESIPEGLMVALEALVKQAASASGIACHFECEPPVQVDDAGTAVHLFRIAQEAVHNAVRHSGATRIVLRLERTPQSVEITVTDDGRGLSGEPASSAGMGLASMHQRARLLGGDCSIGPGVGGGTVVMCWVPAAARPGRDTRMQGPGPGDGLLSTPATTPKATR